MSNERELLEAAANVDGSHAMSCTHIMTQGRKGETGSWCVDCGIKVYAVDERECQGCQHSKNLLDGWICSQHLMRITADMHVTFKIANGTCFEAREAAEIGKLML